jgi:flagellar biosynthetic protein FlhB
MPDSAAEKTEKATPKKREDERKRGNIFQSADVVSAVSVLAVFTALRVAMPYIYRALSNLMTEYIGYAGTRDTLSGAFTADVNRSMWFSVLILSAPVLLASAGAAVLVTGVQTRFKFSGEKIKFKASNISPIQGFKRLFSLRAIVEVLKAIIKTAIIGYIIYLKIRDVCVQCTGMLENGVMQSAVNVLDDIMDLVIQMSVVLIALAAADYFYQWWEYERNIRMSKQELKEEYKELEGNPETKGRIRQLQRDLSRRRMMQQVPTADVIVRNPTHFAVALRYAPEKNEAPVVVAKGQDRVALRIIEIAAANNIPMREDRPLARALYASVEVGSEIPPEFYAALATIMAWVFQLKKEMKR